MNVEQHEDRLHSMYTPQRLNSLESQSMKAVSARKVSEAITEALLPLMRAGVVSSLNDPTVGVIRLNGEPYVMAATSISDTNQMKKPNGLLVALEPVTSRPLGEVSKLSRTSVSAVESSQAAGFRNSALSRTEDTIVTLFQLLIRQLLIRQLNTSRRMGSCRINKLRAEARKNNKMY